MYDYAPLSTVYDQTAHWSDSRTDQPSSPAPSFAQRPLKGKSWIRFTKLRANAQTELIKLREIALYLGAECQWLDDASLLVLGLKLNETLTLSERFAGKLAIEATIAGFSLHD